MSDVISRKAAINTVINMRNRCGGNIDDYYDLLIESFKVLTPSEEKTGRWVSCSERLPKPYIEVLVTVEVDEDRYIENAIIQDGEWHDNIYDRYNREVYGRERNAKIIAWQPLPECYRGDKG